MYRNFLFLINLFFVPVLNADVLFKNLTNTVKENFPSRYYGLAITDINNDRNFDLIVSNFEGANFYYTIKDNFYIKNHINPFINEKTIGVAACDIDEDGYEEVYFLNTDTFGGLKRSNDNLIDYDRKKYIDILSLEENLEQRNYYAGRSVGCIDKNGSGKYDIFVVNYGGPNKVLRENKRKLSDVSNNLGLKLVSGGRSFIAVPFFSEKVDIFIGNENDKNFYFKNSSLDKYEEKSFEMGISDRYEHVRGVTSLDLNNDGLLDLVYGNWEGNHRMFVQKNGRFENIANKTFESKSKVRTVLSADFDNNGFEEIFFNNIGEPNRLFEYNEFLGVWESKNLGPALEPNGLGTGAVVADLNLNGRLELFISHGESGRQPLTIYENVRNDNNFIRILPLTKFNAPARGAKVKVIQNSRAQIRFIDSGSGYLCQMEPVAHFGLGKNKNVIKVIVEWPDGNKKEILNPIPNKTIKVLY